LNRFNGNQIRLIMQIIFLDVTYPQVERRSQKALAPHIEGQNCQNLQWLPPDSDGRIPSPAKGGLRIGF
jgi:hypothetical protein